MNFDESLVDQAPKIRGVCSVCGAAFVNGKLKPEPLCKMHYLRSLKGDRRTAKDPAPMWMKQGRGWSNRGTR